MANKPPEKVFRIGSVSASVFANDVDTDSGSRCFRNVKLERRYKDGDDWKGTSQFGLADIPHAIRVLQLAQQHVEGIEAEVGG